MRRIILALLLVFPFSGYGQTAKYILDGNDDVKIEFFNSTNVSVISNAVFSNSSAFRNSLGLGWSALTNTNPANFRSSIGLSDIDEVYFSRLFLTRSNSRIVLGTESSYLSQSNLTFWFNHLGNDVFSIGRTNVTLLTQGGALAFGAGNNTGAAISRTNLGLGWSALTNVDASGFQVALFNSSSLNAQSQRITNLAAPVNDGDAATRAYVFGLFSRVAPSISFVNTTGTAEIGSMIMNVTLAWSISPTNTPVSSQSISASQGTFNAINTTSRTTTAFIPGPQGFPNQPFTSDATWTLTVNDGTGLPGATVTTSTGIAFRHYMSWGIASTTSLSNSQILNLHTNTAAGAGREFRTGKGKSVSISGNGQYIYFAYPASFGTASFIVNNAPNTAWISNSVTYTNSSGNVSQFLIYRSTDVQFGTSIPITIN